MVPAPSHGRRAVVLLATVAAGALIGAVGHALTGDQTWFLAAPAGVAGLWLLVADPTRCLPDAAEHEAAGAVKGDDEVAPRR